MIKQDLAQIRMLKKKETAKRIHVNGSYFAYCIRITDRQCWRKIGHETFEQYSITFMICNYYSIYLINIILVSFQHHYSCHYPTSFLLEIVKHNASNDNYNGTGWKNFFLKKEIIFQPQSVCG